MGAKAMIGCGVCFQEKGGMGIGKRILFSMILKISNFSLVYSKHLLKFNILIAILLIL